MLVLIVIRTPLVATGLCALAALSPASLHSEPPTRSNLLIQEQLQDLLAAGPSSRIVIGEKTLPVSKQLLRFYAQRAYEPAWIELGSFPRARVLLKEIRRAHEEGLRPADYRVATIEVFLPKGGGLPAWIGMHHLAQLDLLLTDAYLRYGADLLGGRADQQAIAHEWAGPRPSLDLARMLQRAMTADQMESVLRSLRPRYSGYDNLKQALASYRRIAARGGWPKVPEGPRLRKGDRDSRVRALRVRLLGSGDLPQALNTGKPLFDAGLQHAVRKFQRRHGLDPDGVVDAETLAVLNVTVDDRIRQLIVNLERMRWLPPDLGLRHILVNIANFHLEAIENNRPVMRMRVVVGKPAWRTPSFGAMMTYLVLNPSWYIPPSIATKEILPILLVDPDYLTRRNIKIYERQGLGTSEIDPTSIDWTTVEADDFPYRLRQEPGPLNPLGRVKFIFPNPSNICLHDTPARELFRRTERKFSHGCIRIEKPIELAEYVLRDHEKWTRREMLDVIEKGVRHMIRLPEPVPIYLVYWTAWAEEDRTVHFRNDFYEYDNALADALGLEPRVHQPRHPARVMP